MRQPLATAIPPAVQPAPRSVTILGATGSVGTQTVDLLRRNRDAYRVEAVTANANAAELARVAIDLGAAEAVVADPAAYGALKDALAGTGIRAAAGAEAVRDAAAAPADWVMAAIVGAAGIAPTMQAVQRGATVAFANKECLVSAGALMMDAVARHGATLLPVDSEHNAIFQVFDFARTEAVSKLILTASGGPFRNWSREAMAAATPAQAVSHPTWSMGAKISVDSASMMNKGLEIIEAHWLFGIPEERIEVLVHPQSVVHSLVEYIDGSVLAQLGTPDMRTPIAYALAWPARIETPCARLDLARTADLSFAAPDMERFPALALARAALRAGGAAPAILNAANEIAVCAFLEGRIGFLDIEATVSDALAGVNTAAPADINDVLTIDAMARRHAKAYIERTARAG